jgi:hypothetical protein
MKKKFSDYISWEIANMRSYSYYSKAMFTITQKKNQVEY